MYANTLPVATSTASIVITGARGMPSHFQCKNLFISSFIILILLPCAMLIGKFLSYSILRATGPQTKISRSQWDDKMCRETSSVLFSG